MSKAVEKENANAPKEVNEFDDSESCKNCRKACDPYNKPSLCCIGCDKKVHTGCLQKSNIPAVTFVGDVFFELNCASCNPLGEDMVVRDKMPWLNVIVLTLYNLREKSSGISKKGYFHWKSDISSFVDKHWDFLFQKTV